MVKDQTLDLVEAAAGEAAMDLRRVFLPRSKWRSAKRVASIKSGRGLTRGSDVTRGPAKRDCLVEGRMQDLTPSFIYDSICRQIRVYI